MTEDDWQIAGDIKDGNINQFLLKPIDYMIYRICLFFSGPADLYRRGDSAGRDFSFFSTRLLCAPCDLDMLPLFLISMALTALLQFFMSYTMAMLAFWVLEVSTFIFILFAFEYIAGGHLFPIDILPRNRRRARIHPFSVSTFFPGERLFRAGAGR